MKSLKKQTGLSMSEVIVWVVLLVVAAIMGMKLVPAYTEAKAVENAMKAIADDPKMKNMPVEEIRLAFSKRSLIENFTSVSSDQINIEKKKGQAPVLSAEYASKIPIAGNVFLLVEFKPSSANIDE